MHKQVLLKFMIGPKFDATDFTDFRFSLFLLLGFHVDASEVDTESLLAASSPAKP
jgi:hypothetical protein